MNVTPDGTLPELLIVEPDVFGDERGRFFELYHAPRYRDAGIDAAFVQDNVSVSSRNILRGLHYQIEHQQGKLVTVLAGAVYDVAVDIRRGSPTFGRCAGFELTGKNRRQVYIPPGFAHGFVSLVDGTIFCYKCTDVYTPGAERGICWSDPSIGIDWPVTDPVVNARDAAFPRLDDCPPEDLPS